MFRPSFSPRKIILLLLLVSFQAALSAQQNTPNLAQLREDATEKYAAEDYPAALAAYRILLEKYPRDAMYQYYAGTCLLKMNQDLPEAIRLLKQAAGGEGPVDAYYQLALACQREYRFDEARDAMDEFRDRATRHELKGVQASVFMESIEKARELTRTYNPYEVLNVTFLDLTDSVDFSQIRMKGGILSRKPESLFATDESRTDLNSLMFIPRQAEKNEYVYYSGLKGSGKSGFQLFRVRKGLKGTWGPAEELSGLCSEGDEILPYFDPIGKDIYFASDGFPGIGGFDLYKSHYNEEKNEWTPPVNMGFPINSSADEYLLLPGSDLGMEMFFSTRQGTDSTVTVYRVHFSEPRQPVGSGQPERIKEIASLGNVAQAALEQQRIEKEKLDQARMPVKQGGPEETVQKTAEETKIQRFVPAMHPTADNAYQKTLKEALTLQAEADSLSGLAIQARVKVRESDDPNDRWLYQKQILVWEKRAAEAQSVADSCYTQLATLDREAPPAPLPEAIEVDTVINDLTVYSFKDEPKVVTEKQAVKGEPGETVKQVIVEEKPEVKAEAQVINRFEVLASSPYNAANPIPLNIPLPKGSFYRIQLGAYSKAVDDNAFGGIIPITGEEFPDRGLIKYYAGKFSRYADAQKALNYLRTNGYPDAYIVSWYNGSLMSVSKAKELEL